MVVRHPDGPLWTPNVDDEAGVRSRIAYADPEARQPQLEVAGQRLPRPPDERTRRAQAAAAVPLIISGGVHLIFFLTYWLPETSTVPGRTWWLTQLAPLASKALTSNGEPQVPAQVGQWGAIGGVLLVCSLALFVMSRTSRAEGRNAMLIPAGVGLLTSLIGVVALLATLPGGAPELTVLLLAVWVGTAAYAATLVPRTRVAIGPRAWTSGIGWLAAYALAGPLPVAVGRSLFAPELRDAAALVADNTMSLRLAALLTGASVSLYLCGLLAGVVVWVGYHCWPPRRDPAYLTVCLLLGLTLAVTAILGWPAATEAARRATQLRLATPVGDVRFACGAVLLDRPSARPYDVPAESLVVGGSDCRTAGLFRGYREEAAWTVPVALSEVRASTPEGEPIAGPVVAARYGDVVVVAATDRTDGVPTELVGLNVPRAAVQWRHVCTGTGLQVRFARVPGGEDPGRGHLSRGEAGPTVVMRCENRVLTFDPATGPLS